MDADAARVRRLRGQIRRLWVTFSPTIVVTISLELAKMEIYEQRHTATITNVPPGVLFVASISGTYRYCIRTFDNIHGSNVPSFVVLGPYLEDEPHQPILHQPEQLDKPAMVVGQGARFFVPPKPAAQRPADDAGNNSAGTVVLVGDKTFLKVIHSLNAGATAIYVNVDSGEIVTAIPPGPFCVVDQWRIVECQRHADVELWKFPTDE